MKNIPDLQQIFSSSFQNEQGEYADNLSVKEVQLLFDHRLFKCFLPVELGGLALTMPETLQIIEEASFLNGSLGWLVQIGNGGMYFVTNFEKETAEELFSPATAVIAGSGTATTKANKTEAGYLVSGKWNFCSGSEYATLFTLTFLDEKGEIRSAAVPRKDVIIHADWDTIGMRHSSTNTIEVKNCLIPEKYTFKVSERKSYLEEPVFNLPFLLYAQAFFIPVVYGVTARFLEESVRYLATKNWSESHPVRQQKLENLLQEGKSILAGSKEKTEMIVAELLAKKSENPENEQELAAVFIESAKKIRSKAHEIYAALGIDVLYRKHPVCICYNDLLTASQHKLLND